MPGKGRRDRTQAREKLGQQKGGARPASKKSPSVRRNAGIRLKRNLAEELEDLDAFAAAKLIPDGIRCYRREHDVEQRSEKNSGGRSRRARPRRATAAMEGTGNPSCSAKTHPSNNMYP